MIFLTVLQQVLILMILIGLGVIVTKAGVLDAKAVSGITDFVLLFVTPCVIIKSFLRKFDRSTLHLVLMGFLTAVIVHLIFIVLSVLFFRSKNEARRRVLRFGVVFTNCGFMSLPLQEAILGADGVLCGASFVAIFNLIAWSYGIFEICGDKKYITPKKLICNPGLIGLTLGFLVFVFSVPLPKIITEPIGYLAALNTPLPMVIIGFHLANSDLKKSLRDVTCLLAVAARLVLFPVIALAVLYLCGIRGTVLVATTISAIAPAAAITTMFSAKFGQDTDLSVNLVSLSTVLSMITMPLLITAAQLLA